MGIESSKPIDPLKELELLEGSIAISLNTFLKGFEESHGNFRPFTPSEAKRALEGLLQQIIRRSELYRRSGNQIACEKDKERIRSMKTIANLLDRPAVGHTVAEHIKHILEN